MKRKLLMVVALVGVLAVTPCGNVAAIPVQAAQVGGVTGAQPRYINAANIGATLKIEGATAYVFSTVTAKRVCRVSTMMRLQRKNGSTWETIRTWTATSDKGTLDVYETVSLTKRGTYRVYTEFDVAGEELTYTSDSKTY